MEKFEGVNWDNLMLLAGGIEKSRMFKFDMWSFRDIRVKKNDTACGTVACALGHGPCITGLEPKDHHFYWSAVFEALLLRWPDYTRETFGIMHGSDLWRFLFDSEWKMVDNTKGGAIARIRWVIKNKRLPAKWREMLAGTHPLIYRKKKK